LDMGGWWWWWCRWTSCAASHLATKLCDFVGGRQMSGVSSFVLLDFNNKQRSGFFFYKARNMRALKKDQGATCNKAPIWRVSSTDKFSMRISSPWIVYLYFYRWPVLCPNLDYSIIAIKDSGTYIWRIIKLSLKSGD
jgi:hypothetical protein